MKYIEVDKVDFACALIFVWKPLKVKAHFTQVSSIAHSDVEISV